MGSANGYVLAKYLPKVQRAHDSFTVKAAQRKLRLETYADPFSMHCSLHCMLP